MWSPILARRHVVLNEGPALYTKCCDIELNLVRYDVLSRKMNSKSFIPKAKFLIHSWDHLKKLFPHPNLPRQCSFSQYIWIVVSIRDIVPDILPWILQQNRKKKRVHIAYGTYRLIPYSPGTHFTNMDKYLHPLYSVIWNCLSIPKLHMLQPLKFRNG